MKRKRSDILQLFLSLGIVLISAFLLSFYFFKIDLTEEKRHSLTPSTKDMLENLNDKLFIRCYLHGEFPAEYKYLEKSIKERLDEFVDYSNGQINYEFIDPYGVNMNSLNSLDIAYKLGELIALLVIMTLVLYMIPSKKVEKFFILKIIKTTLILLIIGASLYSMFDWINPQNTLTEEYDPKIVNETFKALDEKGLAYSNLSYSNNGAQTSKLIWPGAIVEYQGREYPIQFLKTETPVATDQMVNTSVNNLEYELANSLRKITRKDKPAVAILTGHREIPGINLADFIFGLRENYDVEPVRIDSQINAFSDKVEAMALRNNRYAALVVAGPDSIIGDKDRFIIDQFIMNGGKVLWMLDALQINMDSLRNSETTMAVSNENGVYEMLFEYGVRLNRSLVIDFQGAPIILDNGPMGNQRAYSDRTNYYAPLLLSTSNTHPITANLDPIKLEFAGSLDSVNASSDVVKIPLLKSSPLSKELRAPVRVDLQLLAFNQQYFENGANPERTMAMILEGKFPSAFRDQTPDAIKKDPSIAFRDKSLPTKMIVIADGDIAYNDVDMRNGKPMPIALGYDPQFRRVLYDNKEFLMNCMNYLLDDQALISVRSRTIELRKLAAEKYSTSKQSSRIIAINILLPFFIVIVYAVFHMEFRKRKWALKQI